jgi:hypothetical protein
MNTSNSRIRKSNDVHRLPRVTLFAEFNGRVTLTNVSKISARNKTQLGIDAVDGQILYITMCEIILSIPPPGTDLPLVNLARPYRLKCRLTHLNLNGSPWIMRISHYLPSFQSQFPLSSGLCLATAPTTTPRATHLGDDSAHIMTDANANAGRRQAAVRKGQRWVRGWINPNILNAR